MRKTLSIAKVLFDINRKNALSTVDAKVRQGWNSLIESILMAADVYSGFGYLETADLPQGHEPGIRFRTEHGTELRSRDYYDRLTSDHERRERGEPTLFDGDTKAFPDESRRVYYVHHAISAEYRRLELANPLPLSAQQKGIDRQS